MKKFGIAILLIILALSFSACWGVPDETRIDTDEARKLIQDVKSLDTSVKNIEIIYSVQSYAPPFISIDIFMDNKPGQQIVDTILDDTKQFVTIDNIKMVNKTADVDVFLRIYTDNEKKEPSIQYATRYYKSNDHTDDSPENINGFQTWVQGDFPD